MQWARVTVIALMARSKRAIIYEPSNSFFVYIWVREQLFMRIFTFRNSNIKAYKKTFWIEPY
jgi:hypothetical protein